MRSQLLSIILKQTRVLSRYKARRKRDGVRAAIIVVKLLLARRDVSRDRSSEVFVICAISDFFRNSSILNLS